MEGPLIVWLCRWCYVTVVIMSERVCVYVFLFFSCPFLSDLTEYEYVYGSVNKLYY